jgi:ABC-type amino acid transport substrate-binding protein
MLAKYRRLLWLLLILAAEGAIARETLVIGVEGLYYLPLSNYENGAYRGYARDLLDAFARDRGYAIEYRALPVPRLYASFFEGEVDFKFPDNAHWKQDQRAGRKIHYSDPVAAFIDGTSTPPGKQIGNPDQIRRLGTMGGFTPWAWMDRIKTGQIRVSENTRLEALVRQALAGRVDGVYASVAVINYQLDHVLKRPGALVFNPALPHSRDDYHLSTIKRPEIMAEFNDWMRKNRDRIAAIKIKYGVEKGVTGN